MSFQDSNALECQSLGGQGQTVQRQMLTIDSATDDVETTR